MKYHVSWRNIPAGFPEWRKHAHAVNRKGMLAARKNLKYLGHETQVLLENGVEIEVEDDDT